MKNKKLFWYLYKVSARIINEIWEPFWCIIISTINKISSSYRRKRRRRSKSSWGKKIRNRKRRRRPTRSKRYIHFSMSNPPILRAIRGICINTRAQLERSKKNNIITKKKKWNNNKAYWNTKPQDLLHFKYLTILKVLQSIMQIIYIKNHLRYIKKIKN